MAKAGKKKERTERGLTALMGEPEIFRLDPTAKPKKSRKTSLSSTSLSPTSLSSTSLSPTSLSLEPQEGDAVSRGARWLDVVRTGWWKRMPQGTDGEVRFVPWVDLQSDRGHPLAVAFARQDGFPDYREGVRILCRPELYREPESRLDPTRPRRVAGSLYRGVDTPQLAAYGFAADPRSEDPDPYPALNRRWREEIERRMVEVPVRGR